MPLYLQADRYRTGDLIVATKKYYWNGLANVRMRLYVGHLYTEIEKWSQRKEIRIRIRDISCWACMWPSGEFCSYENRTHNLIKSERLYIDHKLLKGRTDGVIEGRVCGKLNIVDPYEVSQYLRQCHKRLFPKYREEMMDFSVNHCIENIL